MSYQGDTLSNSLVEASEDPITIDFQGRRKSWPRPRPFGVIDTHTCHDAQISDSDPWMTVSIVLLDVIKVIESCKLSIRLPDQIGEEAYTVVDKSSDVVIFLLDSKTLGWKRPRTAS